MEVKFLVQKEEVKYSVTKIKILGQDYNKPEMQIKLIKKDKKLTIMEILMFVNIEGEIKDLVLVVNECDIFSLGMLRRNI